MSATREVCAICGHISRVGFWVPDHIWKEVVHSQYQDSVVCLSCFTERADEHYVEWDKQILFFPVSFSSHQNETVIPYLIPSQFPYPDIGAALGESVKLQSHYAQLLNEIDGGKRLIFKDAQAWIARLRELVGKGDDN